MRRKNAIVLVLCVLLAGYPTVKIWRNGKTTPTPKDRDVTTHDVALKRTGKVVIILTNQRSGSTFLGEFFNQNPDAFYLFEPLLPYTATCSPSDQAALDLLRNISQCEFLDVREGYQQAYLKTRVDQARICAKAGVCFPEKQEPLLERYSNLCRKNVSYRSLDALNNIDQKTLLKPHKTFVSTSKTCGLPLNATLWSALCHSARIVAFKVIRVCSLSSLISVTDELARSGNDVHVIELVRDPRATINSALGLELSRERLDQRLHKLCGRLATNLDYIDSQKTGGDGAEGVKLSQTSYTRVRYEDIATDPLNGAREVYGHLGVDLPEEVEEWIKDTSVDPTARIKELRKQLATKHLSEEKRSVLRQKVKWLSEASKDPYGTVRNPNEALKNWRTKLSMEVINRIQDICGDVMQKLGYKFIRNLQERNDMGLELW